MSDTNTDLRKTKGGVRDTKPHTLKSCKCESKSNMLASILGAALYSAIPEKGAEC